MSFKLELVPRSTAYSTTYELWDIAERNGLSPQHSGGRIRFHCPICDDGGASRRKGRTASGAADLENQPWHCWRASCEASGTARTLAAYFGEVEDKKPRPLIRLRPKPAPKPSGLRLLDIEKAWSDLQGGASPQSLERVLSWCRSRGWPEAVSQAVVLSDEVCFADPRELSGAGRRLAESASRAGGRQLIIPVRDGRGIARTAVRRWPGGTDSAPRPKSLSLPVKLVGPGEAWGGVWAFGSVPAAIQAAASGEPVYFVEGAPDYLGLLGLLISAGLPGAVLGFYQAQTAHRVVSAFVTGLGDLGILAERVVVIPHNDTLSAKEIEKGETVPIGMRVAEQCADLLRGRAGVHFADIPAPHGDFADLLSEDPARAVPLLRVARCRYQKPVPLSEAPQEMVPRFARAVLEATNKTSSGRRGLVVFRVPMGVGKTYNALKAAAKIVCGESYVPLNGKRPKSWPASKPWPPRERSVNFCVPDHALADEKVDELAELAPGTRASHVYGLLNYCHFDENVAPVYPSVGRRGICGPKKPKRGYEDQRCPHRDTCPGALEPKAYRGEVTFSPHALLGSLKADLVIVDESPGVIVTSQIIAEDITSLFACRLIPRVLSWRRYRNPAAGDGAATLARLIQPLAIAHAKEVGSGEVEPYPRRLWGEELAAVLDTEDGLFEDLVEGFGKGAMPPPVPFPAEVRSGHHALNQMPSRPAFNGVAALAAYYERLKNPPEVDPLGMAVEPPKPVCAIRLEPDGTWVLEVRKIQKLPPAPVVVLDATGHLTLAEWRAAYPDRNVVIRSLEVQGAAPARALHIDTQAFTRRSIMAGDGSVKPDAAKKIAKVLEAVARETRAVRPRMEGDPPTRLGLLTHMPLAFALRGEGQGAKSPGGQELAEEMKKLTARGFSFEGQTGGSLLGWYGRHDRGTNAYEAVDGLCVIGDPWGDVGSLDADAFLLGLKSEQIAASRAAATCQQAIARARHIRRGVDDRVVLVFAGTCPPELPGIIWQKERLPGGRPADAASQRVTELLWYIAREAGVIGLPVLERFPREGTPWADFPPADVSLKRRRSAFKKVARGLKWRTFTLKTPTCRISIAAPSLASAESWAESEGFITRIEREAAPF